MKNKNKIILDLCGGTGAWSKSYKDAGYDVRLITLPEYDIIETEIDSNKELWFKGFKEGQLIKEMPILCNEVYGILAAPPCTVFSKAAWNIKKKERKFNEGMEIVEACFKVIWTIQKKGAPLKFWALENPMGYLYNFLGYPHFYFQPWQFGEKGMTATKRTAIWGYFNKPVKTVHKRTIPKINSHSQANKQLPENKEWYAASAEKRAITPAGFAKAFFKANP